MFYYNPAAGVMAEFYRMCFIFGWQQYDNQARQKAHNLLKDALTQEFNYIYGTDADCIESWERLCRILHITPMPEGLHACREASKIHIVTYSVTLKFTSS